MVCHYSTEVCVELDVLCSQYGDLILFNEFLWSFLFICGNIDLPLSQRAQFFSLSILLLGFIICAAVLSETRVFVSSLPLPL